MLLSQNTLEEHTIDPIKGAILVFTIVNRSGYEEGAGSSLFKSTKNSHDDEKY
jgi:hypothetical protein